MTADAFAAGPRARALLRGREIAAGDLRRSGGAYSLEEVRRLLNGVSRQSVEKRVREGRLLAVAGPNNKPFIRSPSSPTTARSLQDCARCSRLWRPRTVTPF